MKGIYFFIFASYEPLIYCFQNILKTKASFKTDKLNLGFQNLTHRIM